MFKGLRRRAVAFPFVCLAAGICASSGCTSHYQLTRRQPAAPSGVSWFGPAVPSERAALARWEAAVGPPIVRDRVSTPQPATDRIVVASWNVAVGAGDIRMFVGELRDAHAGAALVLLLQETYRHGPEVPATLDAGASFPGRLGDSNRREMREREEIEAVAGALGLNAYYVPSMRNGGPGTSDEDRGNAILSDLTLSDLSAIELPFERQRRVAVAATAQGRSSGGAPWRIRFVSAHLDNMMGVKRLWFLGSELARARQARAIAELLSGDDVAIVGGDFNTWGGFDEKAFKDMASAFPDTGVADRRPTFHGLLRLDHVFLRIPDHWKTIVVRARSRYGSDHWPLVGTIEMGTPVSGSASVPYN